MNPSPLRYPGGKYKLYKYVAELVKENGCKTYIEPFCGGGRHFEKGGRPGCRVLPGILEEEKGMPRAGRRHTTGAMAGIGIVHRVRGDCEGLYREDGLGRKGDGRR